MYREKGAVVLAGVVLIVSIISDTLAQRPIPSQSEISSSHEKSEQTIISVSSQDSDISNTDAKRTSKDRSYDINNRLSGSDENRRRRGPRAVTSFECSRDGVECSRDTALDAIVMLHSLLDDDRNGNVDQSESVEFLRDELQYTDGSERQNSFHSGDKQISVDDLWRTWKLSAVYNWTVQDVADWLVYHVELPQYSELFAHHMINGSHLPRLATNTHHYITDVLGIKNPVHKQKLSLKAMDAVLFGQPKKGHSYMNDLAVVASLAIAIGGCWFAYAQHKHAQTHIKRMIKDMESLQKAEDTLVDMQNKLEKAEKEQLTVSEEKKNLEEKFRDEIDSAKSEAERLKNAREGSLEEMSRLKLAEEELKQVRSALKRAEKELELRQSAIPAELQPYLQLTHEVELMHYHSKRQAAERQLVSARDECERIRKKRNTVIGSLRMAHSSSIDEVDQRIANARAALEEVRVTLQERLHRWASMEHLCGFSIVTNPGLATLCTILQRDILPSGTVAYGLGVINRPALSVPLLGKMILEEVDEDLPPPYSSATATLYNLPYTNGSVAPFHSYSVATAAETLKKIAPSCSSLSKRINGKDGVRRHSLNTDGANSNINNSAHSDHGRVKFDLGENCVEEIAPVVTPLENGVMSPGTGPAGMIKSKSNFSISNHRPTPVENGVRDLSSHRSDPNLCHRRVHSANSDLRNSQVNTINSVQSNSQDYSTILEQHHSQSVNTVREDSHSSTDSTDSTENDKKKKMGKKRRKFLPNFLKKDKNSTM